jgi:hypothetical protein
VLDACGADIACVVAALHADPAKKENKHFTLLYIYFMTTRTKV